MDHPPPPLISVVVKCFNEERNLARCIQALIDRTAPYATEIILADCVSSDRTVEIAGRFPVRIVQLGDPADRGCGAAAQLGWQHARGEYLLLIDADMELYPGFLQGAVAALQGDPSLAGAGGMLIEMSSGVEFRERALRRNPDEQPGLVKRLSGCALYRNSALGADGYFMDRNLHCLEEFEAGLRLRARGWRLLVLPIPSVRHYGHADTSLALLARRWTTRGFDGYGEVLRASWARPSNGAAILACARACRFQAATILWWIVVACLALAAAARPWQFGPVLIAALVAPLLSLILRKRDLGRALHSWCVWQVSAAALIRGVVARRVLPTVPLASVILQDPAPPATLAARRAKATA